MPDFSSSSFTQSELVFYNRSGGNQGIYIEWERYSGSGVSVYNIYRSEYFDGEYELIDAVIFPKNEYVDTTGKPSYFYKIEEIGGTGFTVSYSMSQPISGDELLTKSSLRFELEHLLNIPVYDEEVIFNANRTSASVAFPYWNYAPRPQVRITGASNEGDSEPMKFLSEYDSIYTTLSGTAASSYPDGLKYKTDYHGNIYFLKDDDTPQSVKSYDTVMVSYNIKLFTSQHMNSALNMALQSVNSQPGANKYPSVNTAPFFYEPALVIGASYYLLRSLLVSLTGRQRRLLLEDPDAKIVEDIKSAATMYKEDFEKQLEKLPIAQFPKIKPIVVPAYNMPGGRSRFFRYIWNLGTGV
jgi:hypothetical protein